MRNQIPPLDKIDIRLLRVFRVVAECGGFAAAEETLNLNRSTISIHISDLETRFGMRLCVRGPGGFSLTKHGEVVYEATLRLFHALNGFRSTVGGAKGQLMGELSIWLMDNMSTDPCNPVSLAIERFRKRPNEVEIIVNVAPPDEVEKAVHAGRCNLGICGSKTGLPDLEYQQLHTEEITLYCGRKHPLFEEALSSIAADRLSSANFVRRGFVVEKHEMVETGWASDAISMHLEGTLHLIATGLYIGYLPTHYAEQWETGGDLRRINPADYLVEWPIHAIWRQSDRQSAALAAFLEDLFAASAELTGRRAPP